MTAGNVMEEYLRTHPGSENLHERARRILPADGATHSARVLDPFRPYITYARGSHKWDVDGNEYIDYVMGHGALILGHAHPAVVAAMQEQVAKGTHYGDNHQLEVEWAELVQKMMPNMERVEFFSCGQEANLMAIRLSRIFTGRREVLKFADNFHGWADELVGVGTGLVADQVKMIAMHDRETLERELATRDYAILLMEGGGAHMGGQVPWQPGFVQEVSALARRYGTVFLIDEVVTGFRDAPGGWQSIVGVRPDLTSLGKAVGGGLGVGALGGRADVMGVLTPKPPPEHFQVHSGTWNANPLTASAGVAACRLYLDGKVQREANELGAYLRTRGNAVLRERGLQASLYGRNIIWLYLGPAEYEPEDDSLPPTSDVQLLASRAQSRPRLCLHLLQRGVSTMGARFFITSIAHSREDLDRTIEALVESLGAMIAEGSL